MDIGKCSKQKEEKMLEFWKNRFTENELEYFTRIIQCVSGGEKFVQSENGSANFSSHLDPCTRFTRSTTRFSKLEDSFGEVKSDGYRG